MHKVREKLKRTARLQAATGIALAASIVLLFSIDLHFRYQNTIAQGMKTAQSFAEILSEQTALAFEGVERTLREAEMIRKDSLPGKYATAGEANMALQLLVKTSPLVVAVGWTDETGEVIAHSYNHKPPRSNVSGMPHFELQRNAVEHNLYVAPPFRSATADKWLTAVSLRLENRDGTFSGILTAPIDPSYFVKIYRGIDLGDQGSILLLHRDGLLLARQPALDSAMGRSFASAPLLAEHLPRSDAGSYEAVSTVDGVSRFAGYKAVRGLPLVVLVSYDRGFVLQAWYRHLSIFGPLVAFVAAAILLGTWLLARQTGVLAQQQIALVNKSHQLELINARFDMALSQMPNGLVVWGPDRRIVIANARYKDMYGLTAEQVAPGASLRQLVEGYLANGGQLEFQIDEYIEVIPTIREQIHELADGRVMATRRQPTPDGGWIATHQDITEHKRAETLLRATLDTMDQGLIAIDRDGRTTLMNMRALELLELPKEFAASRPHKSEILAYQESKGEFPDNETYSQVIRDIDERRHAIYERQRPNGTVLEIRTVPTEDGGFVRTYTDVTARRAAEAALRQERDRAEAAARATAQFLANMSHELRTPLTAIIGASEMLLSTPQSPERQRHFLEMQRNAGKGLLGIISDILDFSKMEAKQLSLEISPLSLHELANDCIEVMEEQARQKGVELTATIVHDPNQAVLGDAVRLRQVLLNLLGNAVKFTPSGSVRLVVEGGSKSDIVRFTVTDTGIGISRREQATLFRRFVQADSSTTRRFGGTGLGLAISKELIDLMGGTIEVQSMPGHGSTFSFAIMLPSAGRFSPEIIAPTERSALRYRLLLAEDNPSNRELIKAMLEQTGHQVTTVNDGAEAVRVAVRDRFDAILMDVQMPEMDGYAAAQMIRIATGDRPRLPIIALTANALPGESERCLAAGMSVHVPKPVDWGALRATIDRLVSEDRQGGNDAPSAITAENTARSVPPSPLAFDEAVLGQLRKTLGKESVLKLLDLFAVDARGRFAAAPETATAFEGVRREAHTLGGSAGLLGFLDLAEACRILEAAEGDDFVRALDRCRKARDDAMRIVDEFTASEEQAPAESARA